MIDITEEVFAFFLPDDALKWFDVVGGTKNQASIHIILEEKNNPPVPREHQGKHIISKGFKDITIDDFPVRGRKVTITFRRRYWQFEGEETLLKRDIRINHEGTQLEKEFANFLKADC
jgi:hypothetical protein